MTRELALRVTGFIGSLILTLAAYFIILNPEMISANIKTTLIALFSLAFLQSLIQLIFFIDVWKKKEALWNLGVLISTISIIFIIIYFSIWIIHHLNENMH